MQRSITGIYIKPCTPGERGMPKHPVAYSIRATYEGIEGDYCKHRYEELEKAKGDPDKEKYHGHDRAVLIMPSETIQQLNVEHWPVQPGHLGENLVSQGILYDDFVPGKIYRIGGEGGVVLQISRSCKPCTNLSVLPYVGEEKLAEFIETVKGRRGWFARVLKEGWIQDEDPIEELTNYPY